MSALLEAEKTWSVGSEATVFLDKHLMETAQV
jgi:hypothetical protein